MWARVKDVWFPRLLFVLTMGMAAALAVLVLGGPWLGDEVELPEVLDLFANDVVVRRTALGSAAGLAVTACVFFRPGILPYLRAKRERKQAAPPIAGA